MEFALDKCFSQSEETFNAAKRTGGSGGSKAQNLTKVYLLWAS